MKTVPPKHDDDDDDVLPTKPIWRQKWVKYAGMGAALLVLWEMMPAGSQPQPKRPQLAQQDIGDVVPYQEPPREPPETPPPPAPKPPAPPSPPAPAPAAMAPPSAPMPPRFMQPPPQPPINVAPPQAPARPASLSFVVPPPQPPAEHKEPQKPAETGINFKTSTIDGVQASPAVDETYLLMPGLLPCVLDTAVSSDIPTGPLMCHLPGPVYSRKGVLLMEAGTQVIGEYAGPRRGDGTSGNRLMATSAVAYTPNGVIVPLTGPMADGMGASGLPATVDNRLWERFGGAVMLDLTSSALQTVQALASKGNNTYFTFQGNGSSNLAQTILQSTINLPPILTKNPGSVIAIWVKEPHDFSKSYRIQGNSQ